MKASAFDFRLSVLEPIDDEGASRLFDAGVDDGFPETGPAGHSIGFERQASSLRDALLSAIRDVEAAGFTVVRVEPDDLVSGADIAERVGRSRQSISAMINGSRGPGGWPRPVAGNVRSPLWRWSDVQAWFDAFEGGRGVDVGEASLVAAVNELLEARAALRRLGKRDRARLVRELVGPAIQKG